MAAFRQAARDAIDSLGMRPVMFETEPASAQDSRRALLDRIPYCDALGLFDQPEARGRCRRVGRRLAGHRGEICSCEGDGSAGSAFAGLCEAAFVGQHDGLHAVA